MDANQVLFTQRNSYYLRASPYTVIQMVLYLDTRHVQWMNEEGTYVLQKVMELLRPRIMPKLRNEAATQTSLSMMSKKAKVDVLSTEDFRMCYFFRRMNQRHAVLLKEHVVIDPKTGRQIRLDSGEQGGQGIGTPQTNVDGQGNGSVEGGVRSPPPIRVKDEPIEDENDRLPFGLPDPPAPPYECGVSTAVTMGDDEEQDIKPEIRVKYNGFSIFGKMLIVVVEPSNASVARLPYLFDSRDGLERDHTRQLSETPQPAGAAASRRRQMDTPVASSRRSATPLGPSSAAGLSSKRRRTGTVTDASASPRPLFRGASPTPEDAGGRASRSRTPLVQRSSSVLSFGTPSFSCAPSASATTAGLASQQAYRRISRLSGAPWNDREGTLDILTDSGICTAPPLREQSIALSDISSDDVVMRRLTSVALSDAGNRTPAPTAAGGGGRSAREGTAASAVVHVQEGNHRDRNDEEEDEEDWWRQSLREESEAFGLATQMLQREDDATQGDARGIGDDD
ncbi:hypothetical protein K437DRAFT_293262 [Tilletiaria anomala UBC 951]|uniref:Uncharacterized protein n=1 Tax=Tilletiaria anomala (strain ATCC 24038 / CBS 436.72 / UBC 951) TaxID=1037660 RepID=A0A066WI34_TILAU|nr:uncharacterized protein K437DRAFT_293262 [Tilletiaria anomala UBC 951]KDN52193.1 hypothetical protein K437DRAFT_293262 [Tilletiaria anomala UBC 951]